MQLSGTTTLLGLIGSPVAHSKSPAMYNYCFRKFHMDCAYLAFDVAADQVEQSVKAIRTLHMRGANVTMPFKTTVVPYMDRLTPAAETIQAVNTIVNEDGVLVGHNTDGCGYTQNLRRNDIEVAGKKITLIGCGGVGSSIAVQVALEGAAELVGPETVTAEGGMTGTYVRTTGQTGTAVLTVSTSQTEAVRIAFMVGRKPER